MPSKKSGSANWTGGSSAAWKRVRAQVLLSNQIDNQAKCNLAIPGVCRGTADQVHHIYGREVTGDDIKYLQAVCGPCNQKIGSPSAQPDPPSNPYDRW